MKTYLILMVLFVWACQPPEVVLFSDQDKANVQDATTQYGQAIVAKDLDKLRALVDADVTLMPTGMPAVKGTEEVIKFMDEGPGLSGSISPQTVNGSGDLAYVQGSYDLTFQINDTTQMSEQGKYVEIWRKQDDGSWKVLVDIWNANSTPEGGEM